MYVYITKLIEVQESYSFSKFVWAVADSVFNSGDIIIFFVKFL